MRRSVPRFTPRATAQAQARKPQLSGFPSAKICFSVAHSFRVRAGRGKFLPQHDFLRLRRPGLLFRFHVGDQLGLSPLRSQYQRLLSWRRPGGVVDGRRFRIHAHFQRMDFHRRGEQGLHRRLADHPHLPRQHRRFHAQRPAFRAVERALRTLPSDCAPSLHFGTGNSAQLFADVLRAPAFWSTPREKQFQDLPAIR